MTRSMDYHQIRRIGRFMSGNWNLNPKIDSEYDRDHNGYSFQVKRERRDGWWIQQSNISYTLPLLIHETMAVS